MCVLKDGEHVGRVGDNIMTPDTSGEIRFETWDDMDRAALGIMGGIHWSNVKYISDHDLMRAQSDGLTDFVKDVIIRELEDAITNWAAAIMVKRLQEKHAKKD